MAVNRGKLGLQGRYILVNVVMVIAIVLLLSAVQFYFFTQNNNKILSQSTANATNSLHDQMKKRGFSTVNYLSKALINPLYQYDLEATYHLLKPALANEEVVAIYVFDNKGNIFHDGSKVAINFGVPLDNPAVLDKVIKQQLGYSSIEDTYLVVAQPMFIGGTLLGGVVMELSLHAIYRDIDKMASMISSTNQDSLNRATIVLIGTSVILIMAGAVLSILFSNSLVQPIQLLVKHAKRIGLGQYHIENSVNRHDEIGELATAFNDMRLNLKSRTEEISFLAYHDSLTQLPNRTHFTKQLNRLITSQYKFAVLFVDLDEFKRVNDNFGHDAGDQLLCRVTKRIKANLRNNDHIFAAYFQDNDEELVARIGGDEFLICLPGLSNEEAVANVACRLIQAISKPMKMDKEEIVIAGSIGIASYPHDGDSAAEIIKHADIAMYNAKANGKNTFSQFTLQMNEQITQRARVERDLRKAVIDFQQFELWYQPQFEIATNKLVGAEALLRWRHPERGIILPSTFIQIAEETGLIVPIGEWVVESACRQINAWEVYLDEGFHVAVNLSAKQIYQQNAALTFDSMLAKYCVKPERLHAEVTESLLMQDENEAEKTVTALRQLGVQVWLDDFGTGYSSLAYLRRFHFDGVKIDRSFISDIEANTYDRALTSAVIDMAHNLGISAVAEGVETDFHVNFLKQRKCNIGQGFFYSKATPPCDFERQFFKQEQQVI